VLKDSYRAYLREHKSAILRLQYYAVSILWIREGVVPVPPFESRIASLLSFLDFLKEVIESALKPKSNILQDLRVHLAHIRIT
jgi:hypothetical protein